MIPEDLYQCVIEDITPVTTKKWGKPDEEEEKLNFKLLILDDGEFKGQRLFKRVKPVVYDGAETNRPSYLYQIFKAAMKAEPTEKQIHEGLSGNELNALIGKQIRVSVKLSAPDAKGKVYSNVDGILAAKTEMEAPKLHTKSPADVQSRGPVNTPAGQINDEDIPLIDSDEQVDPSDLPF